MWSNPKPDVALLCVTTNDQMVQSNVVTPIFKKYNATIRNVLVLWMGVGYLILSFIQMVIGTIILVEIWVYTRKILEGFLIGCLFFQSWSTIGWLKNLEIVGNFWKQPLLKLNIDSTKRFSGLVEEWFPSADSLLCATDYEVRYRGYHIRRLGFSLA